MGEQTGKGGEDLPVGGENCAELTDKVDKGQLASLLEMGFGKVEAEKAIFFTGNKGVESAIAWLEENSGDSSLKDPIVEISGSEEGLSSKRLTEEEAMEKAKELQRRARELRVQREKEEEIEKEKRRIASTKQLLEAQRKLEEAERVRSIEQAAREKNAHEAERQRQLSLLKEEWEERFGCPYPEEKVSDVPKGKKEKVAYYCNRMNKEYRSKDLQGLLTCFGLLKTYINNVQSHPYEDKYKRIRLKNQTFESKVLKYQGALEILMACGFVKDTSEEFLVIPPEKIPDTFVCSQAVKFLTLLSQH
ncbi:PUG domain fused to an UBA domain [Cryptosporidium canis]|uniref:PUG domain fused to an UBA domain n=1 Tax=Cryptosporidium canis TaxID=195482 RepID=A0A9D5DED2_9CRYT|nr:PUG domain fused to an UBA domain [Cryptosporidium canis]